MAAGQQPDWFKRSGCFLTGIEAFDLKIARGEKLSVYEKFGLFNANLKFAADFDIMCRFIAKEKIYTKYLPGTKVKMRLGGATTKNLRNIIKGNIEIYNFLKKNNVQISKLFFFKKILMKLTQFKL